MKSLGEKSFNFSKATNDIVLRNIKKLNTKKASQLNDVPTKYIKKFSDVFTPVITDDYNNCVAIGIFVECLKLLKSFLHIRMRNLQKKLTTGRLVYFSTYLKFMTTYA